MVCVISFRCVVRVTMKYLVFAVILGCCIVFTASQATQEPGNVVLPNCRYGILDIEENKNNTIVCEGFNPQDTVVWLLQRDGEGRTIVATCDPPYNCTVHQPDHFAVQRSPSHSLLFYQQYDRGLDGYSDVICESQLADVKRTKACLLNMIHRARVSDCKVETNSFFVTGSCRFEQAYSFIRGFTCIWYQKRDNEEAKPFLGVITTTSREDGHLVSGVCNCSWSDLPTDQAASYTYTIDFYPGPGNITVPFSTTETLTTTVSVTSQLGIISTAETTSTMPEDVMTQRGNEESSTPVAAIVGGCIGGVVVIVAVVVVITIVVKRRDATYAKPRRGQTPEHIYDGLHTTITTTNNSTTTITMSASPETTISDQHNLALNDTQHQEDRSRNAHHNPVYVNEEQPQPEGVTGAVYYNQVTQGYTGVTQNPTYVNDSRKAAHEFSNGNRDSNPYYSEIKD